MRKGKYAANHASGTKAVTMLLAVVLLLSCVLGGTLAWLTAKTDEVKNTFTTSDITVTLEETKNNFKMVPGWTIDKDPVVTVKKGSEDCYLFVKVEKSTNLDDYIAYNLATETTGTTWTKLEGENNVYYIKVTAAEVKDSDKAIHLLLAGSCTDPMGTPEDASDDVTVTWTQDQVVTKPSVTKEMMESFDTNKDGSLSEEEAKALPNITFTAYASQLYKNNTETFTAAEAWANVPKN